MCISRTWKGLTSSFFLGRRFNKLVVLNCICKKNWLCSFKKKINLSLRSISNHTLTIIQRLSQCLPSPESPGFLNCCFLPGSPRRWSVSSSTRWGRFLPGDPPRSLTLPCGRSWRVGLSLQWVRSGLSHPERQNISPKENPEYRQVACLLFHLRVPSFQPCQATSLTAQGTGVIGISPGPPEMLLKPVLENCSVQSCFQTEQNVIF